MAKCSGYCWCQSFPSGSVVKNPPANAGDTGDAGSIPKSGRSPGEGASKFGKLSSGLRTGKDQFSFQTQRKAMPKNVQGTTQLHSSDMLAK